MLYLCFFQDTTKIQEIRKLTPANIELYLIKMMIALLEKGDRNKSQDGIGIKRRLVWPEGQQEKRGADQASREGALWNKTQVSKRKLWNCSSVKWSFLCRNRLTECCWCFQQCLVFHLPNPSLPQLWVELLPPQRNAQSRNRVLLG